MNRKTDKDWKQQLRDKLSDREAPVPPELWEGIAQRMDELRGDKWSAKRHADGLRGDKWSAEWREDELHSGEEAAKRHTDELHVGEASAKRHAVPLWIGRVAAAAACIALAWLLGREWMRTTDVMDVSGPALSATAVAPSPTLPILSAPDVGISEADDALSAPDAALSEAGGAISATDVAISEAGDAISATDVAISEAGDALSATQTEAQPADTLYIIRSDAMDDAVADAEHPEDPSPTPQQPSDEERRPQGYMQQRNNFATSTARQADKRHARRKLTASLYAGNTTADARMQRSDFTFMAASTQTDASISDNSAMVRSLSNNVLLNPTYTDYVNRVEHHQPLRFGLSVRYALTQRIAVESGMAYTRMEADIRDGTPANHYHTAQTLHYIGIPLNVIYTLWSPCRLDIYLTGGIMAEKNVKGRATTTYTVGDAPLTSRRTSFTEHRLQWSLSGGAGIQLNVTRSLGLYAEPLLNYYPSNHSTVSNYYKDKPRNLHLKFGLRYDFSNP